VPRLPAATPVFDVPAGLIRILDGDLIAAGVARRVEVAPGKWKIDETDERGRTIDVHALRTTFGTLLSKARVSPRTAQAAMRHSSINLTMNVYTDPMLLDVHEALNALPALPLDSGRKTEAIDVSANGTDGLPLSLLGPLLGPITDNSGTLGSFPGKKASGIEEESEAEPEDVTPYAVTRKKPPSTRDNGSLKWAMRDLNPRHPRCKRGALAN